MALVRILTSTTPRFMANTAHIPAIRAELNAGELNASKVFEVDGEGEDAAEDAFDLTNNPYRQEERMVKYGNGRSASSGDVVELNGGAEYWVCLSIGWARLE